MAGEAPSYIIDASSLIKWWDEDYSPDVFEGIPKRMAALIAKGRLCSVRYVRDEIKDSSDENEATLAKWCSAQASFYLDDDGDLLIEVRKIMARFQDPKKPLGIGGADPFLIARAKINGSDWHVVSDENPSNGNGHKESQHSFCLCPNRCEAHSLF